MDQDSQLFISVIIATHNRVHLLKEALACLEQQTYPTDQYEIIVVDDGSEDGTGEYLRQSAAQGKVRYLRQAQQGSSVARNAGVRIAKGEIVAFTDEDCLPEPDWLASLAESYTSQEPPPVAVGGRIENVSEGHWLQLFYAMQGRHGENKSQNPTYLDSANASFRRAVFLELGGFDETFPHPAVEDVDFGFRLVAAGYELRTNPQALVWHVGSTSLWRLTKRAWQTGLGFAFLIAQYPDFLAGPPSRGWRLQVKRLLNALLRLGCRAPQPVRPLACGLAATWRRVLFTIPEIELFAFTYFANQVSRYRALDLPLSRTLLYLFLELYDYFVKLLGRFYGTFRQTYRQVRDDQVVL